MPYHLLLTNNGILWKRLPNGSRLKLAANQQQATMALPLARNIKACENIIQQQDISWQAPGRKDHISFERLMQSEEDRTGKVYDNVP